ncbi:uncharacterized protein CEXT_471251 [Caerostris extrusa]|uniref:Uncharacterized protein n=1 Tax=Caerostris extrusa TaxID=172846 RepID=A0AAV4YCX1_CAEEX|nr:uncharacterized protein CEXT_471251 [Caerostris extrusa]
MEPLLEDLTSLLQQENQNEENLMKEENSKNPMPFLKFHDRLLDEMNHGDIVKIIDMQKHEENPESQMNPYKNQENFLGFNHDFEDDDKKLYIVGPPVLKDDGASVSVLKQELLKKPGVKRYWAPFQGPKSIVYPHAWLASQIRRSALPKGVDNTRVLETRMAEKKEDPVNSFMHFGRR